MKYKVGDDVRILGDLREGNYESIHVTPGMASYAGYIVTITRVNGNDTYNINLDNGAWNWTDETLDPNYNQFGISSREAVEAISETFSNISKWGSYMKTSEFEKELKKFGLFLDGNEIRSSEDGEILATVETSEANKLDTRFEGEISNGLFNLLIRYASTPIEEREDKTKLFNVQIIKGNWKCTWLYRNSYSEVRLALANEVNNVDSDQQWTLEQIKEYGIDDESVYKRVPVEE